ncbi:MAG: MqnA/MqnD/SBP family protein [Candidatus Sumerlaeia bacterium]|nr:MqnA/MqnD/SBP family protein [Candidatus Sumerlaeia bacterium]
MPEPAINPGKLRLAYVNDLTTLPVTYQISANLRSAAVAEGTMAEVRGMMLDGAADIAFLPAADILINPNLMLVTCGGITVNGASNLILLASKVLPSEVGRVLVDSNDMGAIGLAQYVLASKLRIRPEFYQAEAPLNPAHFDFNADPHDAYLLTGLNAVIVRRQAFAWANDLTQAWQEMTGAPFVLWGWAVNKGTAIGTIDKEITELVRRNSFELPAMARRYAEEHSLPAASVEAFLARVLKTDLGTNEITSMRRFGKEMHQSGILEYTPQLPLYQTTTTGTRGGAGSTKPGAGTKGR